MYGEARGGGQCGVYVGGEGDANVNTHTTAVTVYEMY